VRHTRGLFQPIRLCKCAIKDLKELLYANIEFLSDLYRLD